MTKTPQQIKNEVQKGLSNNNLKVMYSSLDSEWETPQDLFNSLNKEFNFTLDVCASKHNNKCDKFFSREDDGLMQNWGGNVCFMNPPYGKQIYNWVEKAFLESKKENTIVVALIPARTDTRWWHSFCINQEIRFIKGRLKFGNVDKSLIRGSSGSAPFPSAIVIFRNKAKLSILTEYDKAIKKMIEERLNKWISVKEETSDFGIGINFYGISCRIEELKELLSKIGDVQQTSEEKQDD